MLKGWLYFMTQRQKAALLAERRKMIEEVIDMWTKALPIDRLLGWPDAVEDDLSAINRLLSEYDPHCNADTYYK